jgi:hypothetical protein
MFGAFDTNLLTDKKSSRSTSLRELTWWDKVNNYIILGRSKALEQIYNAITSDKPSLWYEELIKGKRSAEEGLIIRHEKYISGSSFS